MTAIIDYGVGNLFSLTSSLRAVGADAVITDSHDEILNADRVILPGVGAFGDAVTRLRCDGLDKTVKRYAESGKPILGICLGMQLLFEKSHEFGLHEGLGLIEGEIIPMSGSIPCELNIPHIGWNGLSIKKSSPILKYTEQGDCVYFVHSFYLSGDDTAVTSYTEYGVKIGASVQRDNVFGCQFHPEKSGEVGLNILRAFCEL